MKFSNISRRQFLRKGTLGAASLAALGSSLATSSLQACETAYDRKLGVALVGLGYYSTDLLGPAFQESAHCYLSAIVTGTPEKEEKWAEQYQIPKTHMYNYKNFDSIKDNPDIDIVYIVLPNGMHAEYTIRAAKAGKHVICEKPMAVTVGECNQMIEACNTAGKLLQIGYRLHYEPYTQRIKEIRAKEELGKIKLIDTGNAFNGLSWDNWRFNDPVLSGGGALMDMGVYSVQGTCYASGEKPLAVRAQSFNTTPGHFRGVEETMLWQMEFPSGIPANCMTSYAASAGYLKVSAEKGFYGLEPAFGYGGLKGYKSNETISFTEKNQQAAQMDAFAKNIMDGTPVLANGEMGKRDMQIMEAIYLAAKSGERVEVNYDS